MKFGVIGTAGIATKWTLPAIGKSDHDVVAIGSRELERAREVAEEFDIPTAYGSYQEVLEDEAVEAIYNPLPNGLHAEWTKKAADAGKHVLCEKPLAANADEARDVFAYCEDADVSVMEGWMYAFHPRTERFREIAAEELGELRYATSTFTFRLPDDTYDVRIDPDLAGGSLMDVGCYCVSGIRNVLGEPNRVYAETADTRDCGVDTQLLGTMAFGDGVSATVACGFDTQHQQRIRVEAENGWVEAHDCFSPDIEEVSLTYSVDGEKVTETFDPVDNYTLEVEAFADAIAAGEWPPIAPEESVANMVAIDGLYESAERGEPVDLV